MVSPLVGELVHHLKVSIVIPTMNEEEGIGLVIDDVKKAFVGTDITFEIIVVDTSSKDRTRDIAREKGAIVIEEPRRGYGRAYKTGFANATGEVVATLDADCTYPAEELPVFARMLFEKDLDFITTNRFAKLEKGAMSLEHSIGNKVLTVTMNILFHVWIRDSQSGMWIFRREILPRLDITSDRMAMSEEIKIEAFKKARGKEFPIVYRERVGEVKLSSWKDGINNVKFLFGKRTEFKQRDR